MKLRDKYKVLQKPNAIRNRVIRATYASMMLEGQGVSHEKLSEIYEELKASQASEAAA